MARAVLGGISVGEGCPVRLMAAMNVSPESFYPASVQRDAVALRDVAQQAASEGADFIDVGAMSTAPYRQGDVPLGEELQRMRWGVEIVAAAVSIPVSADTKRAAVAMAALAAGARIVNDVSGLRFDEGMAAVAAGADGVVLVASEPCSMHAVPLDLVRTLLRDSLARAAHGGVALQSVVLDPGIGFFTTTPVPPARFSCIVLDQLSALADLGRPLLVGVSRKSFIGRLTDRADPNDRLWGSLGATAIAVYNGAAVVRTHDVAATRDAVRVAEAIRAAGS